MSKDYTIVWLRNDLRLNDNPALFYANEYSKKNNTKLVLIYILENFNSFSSNLGSASKWWLHKSLQNFNKNISENLIDNHNDEINLLI